MEAGFSDKGRKLDKIKEFCAKIKVPAFVVLAVSATVLIVGGTTTAEISQVVELVLGITVAVAAIIGVIAKK